MKHKRQLSSCLIRESKKFTNLCYSDILAFNEQEPDKPMIYSTMQHAKMVRRSQQEMKFQSNNYE